MRMNEEIIERFKAGFDQAVEAGIPEPTAMTLSTVGEGGRPAGRVVLLKGYDADGFVFYTNTLSRKGDQLAANPQASLVFWWRENEQQVLIEGQASRVSDEEADAYFATRHRSSQIGAWASQQSRPLEGRFELEKRVAQYAAKFGVGAVPRPPYWSGFRLAPRMIEFWQDGAFRLHDRLVYHRSDSGGWTTERLYP